MYDSIYCVFIFYLLFLIITMVILFKTKQFKNFKDNWFVFGDMEPITVHKMNYQNEKNAENAGVKRINLHGFRHSCASMLINNNVNISVVSNFARLLRY